MQAGGPGADKLTTAYCDTVEAGEKQQQRQTK